MPESPFLEAYPPEIPSRLGEPPDNAEVVDSVRSGLTRLVQISVAVVGVLIVLGAVVVIADSSYKTLLITSLVVVAGCGLVSLVVAAKVMSATSALGELRWADPTPPLPAPIQRASEPEPEREPVVRAPAHALATNTTTHSIFGDELDRRKEVFVKLARRLQSLINRAIRKVDGLEQEIEDPDLLRGLFEVDHLATRVRRQAENLAVLGGEAPQRRSSRPVSVYAVLRSAVAEVEHYKQIAIVPAEGVEIRGHAVAEIIHLLAELLENATTFTAPDSPKVMLRAQKVTSGLAIEVQDRGLGMPYEDLQRINHLLDGSLQIDIGELLEDGRIGLAVVKELSGRHNVRVQLQINIFGGVDAAVVLPHDLLTDPNRSLNQPRHASATRETAANRELTETRELAPARDVPSSRDTTVTRETPAIRESTREISAPRETPREPRSTRESPALRERTEPAMASAPAWPTTSEQAASGKPSPTREKPSPRWKDTRERDKVVPEDEEEREAARARLPKLPVREPGSNMLADSPPPAEATKRAPETSWEFSEPSPFAESTKDSKRESTENSAKESTKDTETDTETGTDGDADVQESATRRERPPLPQRRGQSTHLRPELLDSPSAPIMPIVGHDPSLIASVQRGFHRGRGEQNGREEGKARDSDGRGKDGRDKHNGRDEQRGREEQSSREKRSRDEQSNDTGSLKGETISWPMT